MRIQLLLSTLLIASAVSLSIGGFFLYVKSLVPLYLIETTLVAVVILFILSCFVERKNIISINISTILGLVAPVISYSTPAHVSVLEQIGTGGLISILGVLQLLGFYVFPVAFVILRLAFHKSISQSTVKVLDQMTSTLKQKDSP